MAMSTLCAPPFCQSSVLVHRMTDNVMRLTTSGAALEYCKLAKSPQHVLQTTSVAAGARCLCSAFGQSAGLLCAMQCGLCDGDNTGCGGTLNVTATLNSTQTAAQVNAAVRAWWDSYARQIPGWQEQSMKSNATLLPWHNQTTYQVCNWRTVVVCSMHWKAVDIASAVQLCRSDCLCGNYCRHAAAPSCCCPRLAMTAAAVRRKLGTKRAAASAGSPPRACPVLEHKCYLQ